MSGSLRTSIRGMYIAKAGNNLLPFRLGDAVRIQFVKDRCSIPYKRSLSSILGEMVLDLFVLAILAIIASFIIASIPSYYGYVIMVFVLIFLAMIVLISKTRLGDKLKTKNGLLGLLFQIANNTYTILLSRNVLPVLYTTLFLWGYTACMIWVGLRMILPSVSITGVIATIIFTYLSATIPSAPGFIGTYHAAIAGGLIVMGYSFGEYPAVPVLMHLIQYVPQTLIGLILGFQYLFRNDWSQAKRTIFSSFLSMRKGANA